MSDEAMEAHEQLHRTIDELRARVTELEADVKSLRELAFDSHGCLGKYGDDGEMQCNRAPFIDFKRDTVPNIMTRTMIHGQQRFNEEGGWDMFKKLQAAEARVTELEQEIAGEAEFSDHRLRWVSIQVNRKLWVECCRKHAPQFLPEDLR